MGVVGQIYWALPVWNGMRVIYLWIFDSLFTDFFRFSSLLRIRLPLRSLNKSPAVFSFIRAFDKV